MEAWTITGSLAGVLALLGIPAAFLIYHLQNRTTRRISVSERQQGIYRKALDALDDFDGRMRKLTTGLRSAEEIEELNLEEPLNTLRSCAKDAATPLANSPTAVFVELLRNKALALSLVDAIPDAANFSYALALDDSDIYYRYIVAVVHKGIRQHESVRSVVELSESIRKALDLYRKGLVPTSKAIDR